MNESLWTVSSPLLQAGGGNPLGSLLPLILIFAVFYLFMIRPQQRQRKEQKARADNLQKGDKVVTIGGVHGVVSDLHEKTVVIKTGRDSHVEFSRSAISTVVDPRAPQVAAAPPARRPFWRKGKASSEGDGAANNGEASKQEEKA